MSLYERLGGEPEIARITADIFDTHATNPTVASRYKDSDREQVIKMVMSETHRCMNINEAAYLAVIDDIMVALDKNEYSLKGEVIGA
ncbi:conserved protein of unknown function, low identity with Globin-like protein [Shewanella benthica]|uniref:Uncharacterized protein n=1 Tax=Shewanella benthica TaxID=43661 RepID=A0A330M645_9GAMM|nr:group 1 truncated hemoglobin [Shewanella benthica]SQH77741.1 conserved protein of unknown function, low identity with Globin-like protein [Shewanella benthica]